MSMLMIMSPFAWGGVCHPWPCCEYCCVAFSHCCIISRTRGSFMFAQVGPMPKFPALWCSIRKCVKLLAWQSGSKSRPNVTDRGRDWTTHPILRSGSFGTLQSFAACRSALRKAHVHRAQHGCTQQGWFSTWQRILASQSVVSSTRAQVCC